MKLNEQGLADRAQWESKGYSLPKFDREKVKAATYEKNIAVYEWKCVIGCYIKVF